MLSQISSYLLKISLSVFFGSAIGLEREQQNKPAGFRDVTLVCLGATLFAMIGLQFIDLKNLDMTRLLYGPIIGVGFLGSSCVLRTQYKLEGITTAAVLWCSVALGLLIGIGNYILAGIATIMIYLVLKFKRIKIELEKCHKKRKSKLSKKK